MRNLIKNIKNFFKNEAAYYRLVRSMYEDFSPNKQTFFSFLKARIRLRLLRKYRWYAVYLNRRNRILSNISVAVYEWFYKNAAKLPGRKLYAVRFSRDCDMCESYHRTEFRNWFAYQYALIHMYDDAEGPQSITLISKEEYEGFESHTRDRVMESFENGNGFSIYV